jgi:hypothetical protein
MAFPIGTQIKLVGLPADHGARCNADHGVVQGVTFYLGKTLYAVKCYPGAGAVFFPIDSSNVIAASNPNPPLGVAGVIAWSGPAHHSTTP